MVDRRRTPGEKPADRRRPGPEDGVARRLYWYAWVLVEYAKTFTIGMVALLLALLVGGAGGRLLVPEYIGRPEYGWVLLAILGGTLAVFVLWAKGRMARTGIESR